MSYILFGAGSAGRYALKFLKSKGIEVDAFADNDTSKNGTFIDGVIVSSPKNCQCGSPDATWVATAISRPAATEIRAQIKAMGVKTKPLWECLEVFHGLPPETASRTIQSIATWKYTQIGQYSSVVSQYTNEWWDQLNFRIHPDYDRQLPPSPISELYFPPFISHWDDEHYVDCGAADGDTIAEFIERWDKWEHIYAFEPDFGNYGKLTLKHAGPGSKVRIMHAAVGDAHREIPFRSTGDYASCLDWSSVLTVWCVRLDDISFVTPPTYIKMDIEGMELEAIWGARRILKEHKPVLAICAYHTSRHLWQIPLLIHAIQPDYKLFLRRYGEGAFEIIWYAVPPERVVKPVTIEQIAVSDFDCPA